MASLNQYTDNELLEYAKKWNQEYGEPPRVIDFELDKAYPSATACSDRFGSWNKYIEKAGLKPRPRRGHPYSRSPEAVRWWEK